MICEMIRATRVEDREDQTTQGTHHFDAQIQGDGLQALAGLLDGNEENIDRFFGAGGEELVAYVMAQNQAFPPVQTLGCKVIGLLGRGAVDECQERASIHVLDPVYNAMELWRHSLEIQKAAMAALLRFPGLQSSCTCFNHHKICLIVLQSTAAHPADSLCSDALQLTHRGAADAVATGTLAAWAGVDAIQELMHANPDDEAIQAVCCQALRGIVLIPGSHSCVGKRAVIEAVIAAMTMLRGNPDIQEAGCDVLRALAAAEAASYRNVILDCGGLGAVKGAAEAHTEHPALQAASAAALMLLE